MSGVFPARLVLSQLLEILGVQQESLSPQQLNAAMSVLHGPPVTSNQLPIPESKNPAPIDFHKATVAVLKDECRKRKLKVTGNKAELVARLTGGLSAPSPKKHKSNSIGGSMMLGGTPNMNPMRAHVPPPTHVTVTVQVERIDKTETMRVRTSMLVGELIDEVANQTGAPISDYETGGNVCLEILQEGQESRMLAETITLDRAGIVDGTRLRYFYYVDNDILNLGDFDYEEGDEDDY